MEKNMRLLCSAALLSALVLLTGCATEDNPASAGMRMDETALILNVGETFTRSARSYSFSPVFYTSSDESVAVVDPMTGEVTAVDGGVAIITAKVSADGAFTADSVSYQVSCYKGLDFAAEGDEGRLVCRKGHIHKVDCDEYCAAERVAMVAYVGDEAYCDHGLAIAMKDINDEAGSLAWADAMDYVDTWESNYGVANAEWRMPSTDDFQYMAIGCGSMTDYMWYLSFNVNMDANGLYSKMTEAGVEPLKGLHWTSNGYDKSSAWEVNMTVKGEAQNCSLAFVFFGSSYTGDKARYCLAF